MSKQEKETIDPRTTCIIEVLLLPDPDMKV